MAEHCLRDATLEWLIAFPKPVETCRAFSGSMDLPRGRGRQERKPTCCEFMGLALVLHRDGAIQDKEEAFDFGLRLGPAGATAGLDLDNELSKCSGSTGHRPV